MAPILLWLILVLCLLISVVKYLMGIILKFSFPSTKARKDYTYEPTASVLMPCYNEGRTVYETIESINDRRFLPAFLRLDAKHAEVAVLVVEGDRLDDAGDFLGRGPMVPLRGGAFCRGRIGLGSSVTKTILRGFGCWRGSGRLGRFRGQGGLCGQSSGHREEQKALDPPLRSAADVITEFFEERRGRLGALLPIRTPLVPLYCRNLTGTENSPGRLSLANQSSPLPVAHLSSGNLKCNS